MKPIRRRAGREFERLVFRLLARNLEERFPDAGTALEHLQRIIRSGHVPRRGRRVAGLAATAVLAALGVSAAPRLAEWWTSEEVEVEGSDALGEDWDELPVPELLSLGHSYLSQRTPEGFATAERLFSHAINRDPSNSSAWSGRAHARVVAGTSSYASQPLVGFMEQARLDAEEALELDPDRSEALAVRAMIRMSRDRDWSGARSDFERALELEPEGAETHHWYALFLAAQGELDAAMAEVERAGRIDPESAVLLSARARLHYYREEYEIAEALYLEALEDEPDSVPARLGLTLLYLAEGRHLDAFGIQADRMRIGWNDFVTFFRTVTELLLRGRPQEGETLLSDWAEEEGRFMSALEFAVLYASFRQVDRTLDWLETAVVEQADYLSYLRVDPLFDHLSDHPRFRALTQRLGLDPPTAAGVASQNASGL